MQSKMIIPFLRICSNATASTKLRAKRMQEATEEATVLEKQKQKRREDHEATSSLASSRRTEKIAHKKEKSVRAPVLSAPLTFAGRVNVGRWVVQSEVHSAHPGDQARPAGARSA